MSFNLCAVLENIEELEGRAMRVGWVGGTGTQPYTLARTSLNDRFLSPQTMDVQCPPFIVPPSFSLTD
ncbi:hypothetical protein SISSUDRAFT_1043544 [Sistotremastrum suecicum HHB10207 ss-3]|uniref:Uncharacterized protein n=1 Tax=Sistotremastrum suecicum HHB10207 ss-3 TaxID=1314776 RepID=A0A166FTZ1_9AGAM|nr:hypothetical protein SISSUDRAFT_1043544 [Sistotremastrum suecicum HHB10207 ss-3]